MAETSVTAVFSIAANERECTQILERAQPETSNQKRIHQRFYD